MWLPSPPSISALVVAVYVFDEFTQTHYLVFPTITQLSLAYLSFQHSKWHLLEDVVAAEVAVTVEEAVEVLEAGEPPVAVEVSKRFWPRVGLEPSISPLYTFFSYIHFFSRIYRCSLMFSFIF